MTDDLNRTEARLRAALQAEAESIQPSPDGLRRIEEQVMSPQLSRNRKAALGGVAAALILAVVAVLVLNSDDDDPAVIADDPTTTTETSTETTAETTSTTSGEQSTTTTTFEPTDDPSLVIYPAIDSAQRFDDPASAAFAFATDYAGFTDPVLSDFREGDSRSGEIEITRNGSGPVSTILLRQLNDDSWAVIGAEHEGITTEEPGNGDTVTSPIELTGTGFAFEGNINVAVREQGRTQDLGESFVTAGGSPPGSAYQGEIEYSTPGTPFGTVMYREFSAEDGTTSWVAVTRIIFGDAT